MGRSSRGQFLFRPFSTTYFLILLIWLVITAPLLTLFFKNLLVRGLGLPPEMVFGLLLLSLLGSFVNIPVTKLTRRSPIFTYQEVAFFGVTWRVPQVRMGTRKMLVTVNVGGCLVPLLISLYILLWVIPKGDPNPSSTYIKSLMVLAAVTFVVNHASKIVRGLGIATPAF